MEVVTCQLDRSSLACAKKEGETRLWAGVERLGLCLLADVRSYCFKWRWRTRGLLFRTACKRLRGEGGERIEAKLTCAVQITVEAISDLSEWPCTFCRKPAMLYRVDALRSALFVT